MAVSMRPNNATVNVCNQIFLPAHFCGDFFLWDWIFEAWVTLNLLCINFYKYYGICDIKEWMNTWDAMYGRNCTRNVRKTPKPPPLRRAYMGRAKYQSIPTLIRIYMDFSTIFCIFMGLNDFEQLWTA